MQTKIMKQLTIINGKQSSGKSTMARKIIEGKKSLWIGNNTLTNLRNDLEADTEFIVIDEDFILSESTIKDVFNLIETGKISFRKPYAKQTTTIPTPKIIITSQDKINVPKQIKKQTEIINI